MDFWGPHSGPSGRGSSQYPPAFPRLCGRRLVACFGGEPSLLPPCTPYPAFLSSTPPRLPPPSQNKPPSQTAFYSALLWGVGEGEGSPPVAESGGLGAVLSATGHSLLASRAFLSLSGSPLPLSRASGPLCCQCWRREGVPGARSPAPCPGSHRDSGNTSPVSTGTLGPSVEQHRPGRSQNAGSGSQCPRPGPGRGGVGGGAALAGRRGGAGEAPQHITGRGGRERGGPGAQEHRWWR